MSSLVNPKTLFSFDGKAPLRLDVFLSEQNLGITRSQALKWVEDERVKVNGKISKASYKLRAGDEVEVEILPLQKSEAKAEAIPLKILYQDKHLAFIDKPVGMVVHVSAGHSQGTLVNALLHHLKDLSGIGGELRPGIVHRLDKDTSGVILIAKNDQSHAKLVQMFQERKIQKTYLALAYGQFKSDRVMIENKLGRSKGDRKKISSRTARGKEAKTSYEVLERFTHFALLKVKLHTGRTHQIRVHLAESGHPIVGDAMYGGRQWLPKLNAPLQSLVKAANRQMLHAFKLELEHPVSGKKIEQSAELPQDFEGILALCRKAK